MKHTASFKIEDDYIPLIGLLKAAGIARTGGEAQMLVEEGEVTVNGQPESRKRAKIRSGDLVECGGRMVRVVR